MDEKGIEKLFALRLKLSLQVANLTGMFMC